MKNIIVLTEGEIKKLKEGEVVLIKNRDGTKVNIMSEKTFDKMMEE